MGFDVPGRPDGIDFQACSFNNGSGSGDRGAVPELLPRCYTSPGVHHCMLPNSFRLVVLSIEWQDSHQKRAPGDDRPSDGTPRCPELLTLVQDRLYEETVMVLTVHEETFDGLGGLRFSCAPGDRTEHPRRHRDLSRRQLTRRAIYLAGRAVCEARHGRVRARSARPREIGGRAVLSRGCRGVCERCCQCCEDREITGVGRPVFLLGHSAGGVVSSVYESSIRPNSPGSSAKASRSRCRRRASSWQP